MHYVNNVDEGMTHTRLLIPDVPFHPGPTYRPPPKLIRSNMPRSQEGSQSSLSVENINPDINLDLKKILHFKKALFPKLSKDWTNQEPKKLNELINMGNLIQKCFCQNRQIYIRYLR